MLDLRGPKTPALDACTPELRRCLTHGDDTRIAVLTITKRAWLFSELEERAEGLLADACVSDPAEITALCSCWDKPGDRP